MSSRLLPEISVRLLAATPTCHYLEYVDWADGILEEPLRNRGRLRARSGSSGLGLVWKSDAVKAFALDRSFRSEAMAPERVADVKNRVLVPSSR